MPLPFFVKPKAESKNVLPLQPLKPARSFMYPMPCEITVAAKRNATICMMNQNDVAGVAYRFLQMQFAKEDIRFNLFLTVMAMMMLGATGCLESPDGKPMFDMRVLLFFTVLPLLRHVPDWENYRRYDETAQGCSAWLKKHLPLEVFKEIEKFEYSQDPVKRHHMMEKLIVFFESKGFNTESLRSRHVPEKTKEAEQKAAILMMA